MSLTLERWGDEDNTSWVSRVASTFINLIQGQQQEKSRELTNWRIYSGVNHGQWDPEAIEHLIKEKRPIHTLNHVQQVVDKVAGMFIQSPYKTVFRPRKEDSDKINLAQELFDFDRSNGDWEKHEALFVLSGLIYRGIGEYFVDYAYAPTGDVGWRAINPVNVYTDPFWKSGRICDLRWVCDPRWMSIEEIAETYTAKADVIKERLKDLRTAGYNYVQDEEYINQHVEEYYSRENNQYRVITFTYMVKESVESVVDIKTRKKVVFTDDQAKAAALAHRPGQYKLEKELRRTCRVITICPGLDETLILTSGKHPMQLGHVPYFFWSAKDIWGQPHSLVDLLKDAQEIVNKRESTITHTIGMMANNAKFALAEAFSQNEQERLRRDINKPGQMFFVEGHGRAIKDVVASIGPDQYPQGIDNDLQRAQNYIREILPPAVRGEAAGANETGAHFTKSLSQGLAGLEVSNQGIQSVWLDRARSYLAAAAAVYGSVQRRRFNPKTESEFWTNRYAVDGPEDLKSHYETSVEVDGAGGPVEIGMENNTDNLTRYDVVVTQALSGSTVRDENLRAMQTAMAGTQNPLMRSILEVQMVEYIPGMDDNTKKELKSKGDIWVQFQQAQIEAQLRQLQAPPQPQGAMPPGMPPDVNEVARAPGMGGIADSAGIAGAANMANNLRSPSDIRG
jgi:hypothetical protein